MARASTARHSVQGGGSGKHAQACVDRQRAAVLPTRPLVPPSCNLLTPFTAAKPLTWSGAEGLAATSSFPAARTSSPRTPSRIFSAPRAMRMVRVCQQHPEASACPTPCCPASVQVDHPAHPVVAHPLPTPSLLAQSCAALQAAVLLVAAEAAASRMAASSSAERRPPSAVLVVRPPTLPPTLSACRRLTRVAPAHPCWTRPRVTC